MNNRMKLAALAVVSLLALPACGLGKDPLSGDGNNAGSPGSQVIIGSADFTESQLIASIYSQALQAKGVEVVEQLNIGSREVYIAALKDSSIDLVPEYSGAFLHYLDPDSTAATAEEVTAELKAKLPGRDCHVDAVTGRGQGRRCGDEGHRRQVQLEDDLRPETHRR